MAVLLVLVAGFAYLDMKGVGLVPAVQGPARLGMWALAIFLVAALLFSRPSWPIWLQPLRLTLLLALPVLMAFHGLFVLFAGAGVDLARSGMRAGVEYVAVGRGGLGGTWTDVVERRVVLGLFQRERALAQFERQQVLAISLPVDGVLEVRLAEHGKPEGVERIRLR